MYAFAHLKCRVFVLHPGHWNAIYERIAGKVEAIHMSVLGGDRQQSHAAPRVYRTGRARYVPVMPVPWHQLEMTAIGTGLGIENDNRAGIKIFSLAQSRRK